MDIKNTLYNRIRWIKDHANGKLPVLLAKGEELDAIEWSIKKQLPLNPVECQTGEFERLLVCPICGYRISIFDNYCSNCGQSINKQEES